MWKVIMKKSVLTLAILLSSMMTQAGPIISGGPNVQKINYDCSNRDTKLEVRMTGVNGHGKLTDKATGDELSLYCRSSRQKVDPVSAVVAVCRPTDGSTLVRVISSRGFVGLRAIVNMDDESTSLLCHYVSNFAD
jgi:hypothetical protein